MLPGSGALIALATSEREGVLIGATFPAGYDSLLQQMFFPVSLFQQ